MAVEPQPERQEEAQERRGQEALRAPHEQRGQEEGGGEVSEKMSLFCTWVDIFVISHHVSPIQADSGGLTVELG